MKYRAAFLTGASGGIGTALAHRLAAELNIRLEEGYGD